MPEDRRLVTQSELNHHRDDPYAHGEAFAQLAVKWNLLEGRMSAQERTMLRVQGGLQVIGVMVAGGLLGLVAHLLRIW